MDFLKRKIMKKVFAVLLTLGYMLAAYGQSDEQAIKILDKFAQTAQSAPSISIDFKLVTVDVLEDYNDSINGNIILKGNSYMLSIPNNTIWFNGKTSWSYLIAEEEVTITNPDTNDGSFMNNPSLIFSAYKDGYKCHLVNETSKAYVVDLYPENAKDMLLRYRLTIQKSNYNLISFEYKRKDGYSSTLYANKYDTSKSVSQSTFEFQSSNYKNVDIIDMR